MNAEPVGHENTYSHRLFTHLAKHSQLNMKYVRLGKSGLKVCPFSLRPARILTVGLADHPGMHVLRRKAS